MRSWWPEYLQYWFYYPDSNSTFAGSDKLWERLVLARLAWQTIEGTPRYPGYHPATGRVTT